MTSGPPFLDTTIPMARRVAEFDWAATPLGPIEEWSTTLKTVVALALHSGFAKCLCWGPQHIAIYNDAFVPLLGNKGDCLGLPFSVIWQEAWDKIGPIAEKAMQGKATFIKDFPLEVRRTESGMEEAFFTFSYSPVKDENGTICGFMDTVMDTTERVRYERRAAISNRELVHRMKNSYALVSAVVRQTARNADNVAQLTDKLVSRLSDMAQAQDVLALKTGSRASIEEIVTKVRTRLDDRGTRFSAKGPDVILGDQESFALTLALFELATNAVKYGALSSVDGRISVEWSVIHPDRKTGLLLSWREEGGPEVMAPERRGFGSFLVKQLLAAEFSGEVEVDYAAQGLTCVLTAPDFAVGSSTD